MFYGNIKMKQDEKLIKDKVFQTIPVKFGK